MSFPKYKSMNLRKFVSPKTTEKISDTFHSLFSKFIEPFESDAPKIVTNYPGPKYLEMSAKMNNIIGNSQFSREIINYEKSFGNYFQDIDGNNVLDMHMDKGRNAFGYNHRTLIMDTKLDKFEEFLAHRPSLAFTPPKEYPSWLIHKVMKVAPIGLNDVYLTCGCGSSANENALKFGFLSKFYHLKGNDNLSEEEKTSVMLNKSPGAPELIAIGFEGGYHGKFLTSLSASDHKDKRLINGTKNWPIAPFPKIKYPYDEFYNENIKEEERCIDELKSIIKKYGKDRISSIIIEPIQIDSGIRYASPLFYRNIIDVCYDNQISFICDETQTSGWVGGRPFLHSNWNSEKLPHIVTFAGRMQISGLFYQSQLRPKVGGVVCSTWNGDPAKILTFSRLHDVVHNKDWIDAHCPQFNQSVKSELMHLQRVAKFKISNIRGQGKIFAFDVQDKFVRDEIVFKGRENGFKVLPLGDNTIGFTPSLWFAEFHFSHFKNFLQKFTPSSTYLK